MKTTIQMKFNQQTIDRVNKLVNLTGITNKTQIVANAIVLCLEIEETIINKKGKIYIEYPNGKRDRLIIK